MTDRATTRLRASRRSLTSAERRVIHGNLRSLTARSGRPSRAAAAAAGGLILSLWLVTVLASDAPLFIITAFWLVIGGGIALWVRRDMRVEFERMAGDLESALRRNEAEVYDVRARSLAELEEIEDEGACYAFELEGDRLVFISGQEFYEGSKFPSLDFSLVYVLDEHGRTVDMLIDKRGSKAVPTKTISAASKQSLDVPDHLEVRQGTIKELEGILAPAPPREPGSHQSE